MDRLGARTAEGVGTRAVSLAARVFKLALAGAGIILVGLALVASIGFVVGYRLSPVLSGSMRPAFAPGDAVITRPVPVSSVHPGMIVEFTPPDGAAPFAHRVLTISGTRNAPVITTKGDANPIPDAWHVQLSGPTIPEIVGVVPAAGHLMAGVNGPGGSDFAVAASGLLLTAVGVALATRACRQEPTHQSAPTTERDEH